MLAQPCPLPPPNPPAAQATVEWQQEANFWNEQYVWFRHADRKSLVRFKTMYCRSDYAHMIAELLGGK
jgi:hypothetical protein